LVTTSGSSLKQIRKKEIPVCPCLWWQVYEKYLRGCRAPLSDW